MTTKKAPASPDASDDLRAEYDFDYTKSRPNRFASRMRGVVVVAVVPEPEDHGEAEQTTGRPGKPGGGT